MTQPSVVFLTSKSKNADVVARAALREAGIGIREEVDGGRKSPAVSVDGSIYVGLVNIGQFIRTVPRES